MPSRDPDTGRFISGQADSQEEGTPQVVPPITEVELGAPVEDPLGVPIEDHLGDPVEDDYPDEEDYEDKDDKDGYSKVKEAYSELVKIRTTTDKDRKNLVS